MRKRAEDGNTQMQEMGRPGGDDLPFVFSGTLVTQGQAIARVHATGMRTELGKIGSALQTVKPEHTSLQRETGNLVRLFAIAGVVLCTLVVLLYGLLRGGWLNGLLAGIALAMSLLPEEFPVVLTVFLALGAWRISQKQVLTRRMPAIERLGETTVLCVDKTGTLTENRMTVQQLYAGGALCAVQHPLPEAFEALAEFSLLASQRDPFDPMEQALLNLSKHAHTDYEHLHSDWTLRREYPFSSQLFAISHVWQPPQADAYIIAAKGAPEAIFDLCHLESEPRAALSLQVSRMADEGLRVLGVAKAAFPCTQPLPAEPHGFSFEFVGLVGLADPVRPTVLDAIKECSTAGIRVVMITGDYPCTAQYIGRHIGLVPVDACISGTELDAMEDATLQERIKTTSLFARVVPEQKLRLVNALKANGEVVAMTGDGFNDAPALKAAHVGVAMGKRGTDIAREAASLVLLDDDFSSIVGAVRLGRRIYDNIRHAMTYILASHVPIAGTSLLPLLFGWPLVLLPVQIVFLELIIDPACSVVFEAEPEHPLVMKRPPRDPKEPLFGRRTVLLGLLQGACAFVIALAVLLIALYLGMDDQEVRALTFITLVFENLGLILANRSHSSHTLSTSRTHNAALQWIVGGTLIVLGGVLIIPGLRDLFGFKLVQPLDLVICLVAGAVGVHAFTVLKRAVERYARAGKHTLLFG